MWRRAVCVILFGVSAAGCGHPATLEECELIVERIAELEIGKHGSSGRQIAEEVNRTKQAMHTRTLGQCVGKRITSKAMQCVQNADSSDEIINECLN
jgi:hypothetical protein